MRLKNSVFIVISVILCFALISCGQYNAELDSSVQSPIIPSSSSVSAPSPTNNVSLILEQDTIELEQGGAELIDTSPLYFTEVLGIRKEYLNSLPTLVGFEYPYVFYERMTAVEKGASEEDAPRYIGRYSIETQQADEMPLNNVNMLSDEARLAFDESRVVYMYCFTNDSGNLTMNITIYDLLTGTEETLLSSPVHNVFGYAKKVSSEQLSFFLYEKNTDTGAVNQTIYLYDMASKKISEIYRGDPLNWSDPKDSTRNIWAMSTYNENIYLLMHQMREGEMITFLNVLDKNGHSIEDIELTALSAYDTMQDTADSLVVQGDYIYIHYTQASKEEGNNNPPYAMLRRTEEGFQLIEYRGIQPKRLCGTSSTESSRLFFISELEDSVQEQASEVSLLVLDTHSDTNIQVATGLEGIADFVCDSSGNLIVQTRVNNEMSSWYYIPSSVLPA